jgi:hypothetical protein
MTEDMRVRNLASTTQGEYIDAVAKFAKYFGKSPALLGPEEVRAYQVYLVYEKNFPGALSMLSSVLCGFFTDIPSA